MTVLGELEGDTTARQQELQKVIDAPIDPDWVPEDLDFKRQARQLLASRTRP